MDHGRRDRHQDPRPEARLPQSLGDRRPPRREPLPDRTPAAPRRPPPPQHPRQRRAGIDPLNAEKIGLLELVWSNLRRLYEADAARAWLFGLNPHLGDRRPIDVIRTGRVEELMRAIRAERADAFA